MQVVDDRTGARAFQVMVGMRDGTRLNTFVFLPGSGGPRWPVILNIAAVPMLGITIAAWSETSTCGPSPLWSRASSAKSTPTAASRPPW